MIRICDRLVQHEGPTDIREVLRIHLLLAKWTIAVLEEPWTDARRVEQMVDVAGQRTDQIILLIALHTDGAVWSTRAFDDTHSIYLLEATLTAAVLTPVVRVALLEAVLHISVDLSSVLSKDELYEVFEDLLVLIRDDVLGVAVKELLLVSPQRGRGEASFASEAPVNCPEEDASTEDQEHDQLNPPEEQSHHHGHA